MFRKLILVASVVLCSAAFSSPIFAAGGGHFGRSFVVDYRARGDVPLHSGFAGPRRTGFNPFAHHPDGYDGDRYWYRDECWPTEPGGCDW
jgi:hypothetical protein